MRMVRYPSRRTVRFYFAHRLAWFYVHGEWPKGHVDHINGNRDDNSAGNLRDVSPTVNAQNLRKARSDNKSGLLGVCWVERVKRWKAQINVHGAHLTIGFYESKEEAHQAYVQAKRQHHAGCTI